MLDVHVGSATWEVFPLQTAQIEVLRSGQKASTRSGPCGRDSMDEPNGTASTVARSEPNGTRVPFRPERTALHAGSGHRRSPFSPGQGIYDGKRNPVGPGAGPENLRDI